MFQKPFSSRRVRVASAVAFGIGLAVLGGMALAQQDKYALQVPGGLAFSDFRGYEGWQVVATSQNERAVAVIVANPLMIEAYKPGIPGNGKPFPDGAKMAKVHWKPAKHQYFPDTTVPGPSRTSTSWRRTASASPTAADGAGPCSPTTPPPTPSPPAPSRTSRRRATTPSAASPA